MSMSRADMRYLRSHIDPEIRNEPGHVMSVRYKRGEGGIQTTAGLHLKDFANLRVLNGTYYAAKLKVVQIYKCLFN